LIKSKLIIGTAQFGIKSYGINNINGSQSIKQVREILNLSLKNNISILDTAPSYGDAEMKIGKCYNNNPFKCITKVSAHKIKDIENSVKESAKRLKTNLHAVLIHNIDDFIANNFVFDKLIQLKEEGIIKNIGFSIYYLKDVEVLEKIIHNVDIIQIPFNLFDQRFKTMLPYFKSHKVKIHCRSVFLQGLFFKDESFFDGQFQPAKIKIIELNRMCKDLNLKLSHVLLGFCALNDYFDGIIIGLDNINNLKTNLETYKLLDNIKDIKKNLDEFFINDEKIILPINWFIK
tara:strand:+ start:227 stop:1093 length:867 start_codon:yes stop_codon:yes gene_type:complete